MSVPMYPKYKDTGVEWLGDMPEHWRTEKLKRLASVRPSNVDKKTYPDELPVRLCNYTDVYYNDRIDSSITFMAATASSDQIDRFGLRRGDVVITKDSETADDIAVPALVTETVPNLVCGYHLAIVRPADGVFGPYMKYAFESHYARSMFEVRANGLTRMGLSQYALDNAIFPTPSFGEQVEIANFLDGEVAKIDALVAGQRRLIDLLVVQRQAVIAHAVTKGLNPDARMKPSVIDWVGDIPAHWNIRAVGSLTTVVRGASPRPAGDSRFFGGNDIPWVTVAEITKNDDTYLYSTQECLTAAGKQFSRVFPAATLIYSNSGATLGVPKILGVEACANDGVIGFLDIDNEIMSEFLYFCLGSLTPIVRDMVKQGSGQPNLNTDIVKRFRIAVPPVSEQRAIVRHITQARSRFVEIIEAAGDASALLEERRSALISAAVTGKIDVRGLVISEAA